ncbi:Immunoglobulin-like domain,Immunoglobulin subtype,Immunoglobulin V-set domain,Immunoglobulin-like [Cinara cedri]|uniref:Immunoglobulin-like domain,Immunoglobulin subtype,Immunoglobulin V-set domain,Immunoglobulin-like n=1 Tax=Cinara cedri TaxID=506608 RepID=A0A5E4NQ17_9HEMI|nr:Immunoglobulin-like domain,Immunoglobulin subtype,Immunoglobulin V-set domain,Immunoglobulin-like [Cinara cedri]
MDADLRILLVVWILSTMGASPELASEVTVPLVPVDAVEGRSVKFPCDVSSPNHADKVYMVFWFKDDSGVPLYSFDVRGMPLDQAHHYSAPDVLGERAKFQTDTEPACLDVNEVQWNDKGVYRCRVDFRNSATKSFRYNLSVIKSIRGKRLWTKIENDVVHYIIVFDGVWAIRRFEIPLYA